MKNFLSSKIFLIFLVLGVILLLFFLHLRGWFGPIERFIYDLTMPFQKFFKIIANKISDFIKLIVSISTLNRENQALKKENEKLLSNLSEFRGIKEENEILRKELGLLPWHKYRLVSAFVISFEQSGLVKSITIDKGQKDGIKNGMPVIISDGILVGQIKEASPHSAKVLLITDSESRIDAKIPESGASGIIRGKYGLDLSFEDIPQDIAVKKDDLVVTYGKSSVLPENLVIGRVQEVYSNPNDIFQKADVVPETSFSSLKIVSVILNFSL